MNKYKCTASMRGYPCYVVEIEACTMQLAKIRAKESTIKKYGSGIKIGAINADLIEGKS